ncbi:tRNA (N6-threonylcarbamoyladenosine(37)-N6)-methyltransferase TrmO [Desertibaculum subflavum]|uniref:tRNA (N6-threonylcarbamoyladenosine(37)-N6)-methyltransferase TrmO n=1 Tax=Desertibaculum subflavum TaxID=2268458 RepID=UPI0034D27148
MHLNATLTSIGRIETPFASPGDCPRNGRALDPAPLCRVHVDPAFQPGLQGIDGFSHLILVYWLHLAETPDLVFTPPFDARPRGVFATRSPRRPNPIGLSVVAFEGMEAPGVLKVRYLDCVDGTPLIDIKPYLRTTDAEPEAAMGWLGARPEGKNPAA